MSYSLPTNKVISNRTSSEQIGTKTTVTGGMVQSNQGQTHSSVGLVMFGYALFAVMCISGVVLLALFGPKKQQSSPSATANYFGGTEERTVQDSLGNMGTFPIAESTWYSKFFTEEASIPVNSYTVIYFDRANSQGTKQVDTSDDIFITNYHEREAYYKIYPTNLAVYLIGKKTISTTSRYKIFVNPGSSSARVMIDKKIIFEGRNEKEVWVTLEQGERLIEVEFLSAAHSPELTISFLSEEEANKRDSQKETDAFIPGVPIWYVGIYEPTKEEVVLSLPNNKGDITLVLSSYEKTKWKISPASGTRVVSIFVSSYEDWSPVLGVDSSTLVVYRKERGYFGLYELYATCNTYPSTHFYCENLDQYTALSATIKGLSGGGVIATYTGAYSTSSMLLPSVYLTESERKKLDSYPAKVKTDWEYMQKMQNQVN